MTAAVTPRSKKRSSVTPINLSRDLVLVLAIVGSIRFGSIFNAATISWDENTFILVAQRLTLGELPYTTTFDNKPPLFVVLQALLLGSSSSLALFRLSLVIVISITALAVRVALLRAGARPAASWIAVVAMALFSASAPAGGAWMSQHAANLWLAILLLIVMSEKTTKRLDVGIGLVVAVLVLTRTNYLIPAMFIVLLDLAFRSELHCSGRVGRQAAGFAVPVLLTVAVYWITDSIPSLISGVIDIVVRSGGQGDPRSALAIPDRWLLAAVAMGLLLHACGYLADHGDRTLLPVRRRFRALNIAALMGTALSIQLHSAVLTHYLLILVVPLAASAGLAVDGVARGFLGSRSDRRTYSRKRAFTISAGLAASLTLLVPAGFSTDRLRPADPSQSAFESELVNELRQLNEDKAGTVWALNDHFVYWRLEILPPDPLVTHPSNLMKPEYWMYAPRANSSRPQSGTEAINRILQRNPTYIVSSRELSEWYLRGLDDDERHSFVSALERDYEIVWAAEGRDTVIRARMFALK